MTHPILLQIAKAAILNKFDENHQIDRETLLKDYPFLDDNGAVFVTLKYDNELRGCIGSIISHRKLYDDTLHNAISAGFSDPRFNPLHVDELSHLTLELSVLSKPTILEYSDYDDLQTKVKPHVDGLILKHKRFQGTFLPQVWEQLQTPKLFLEHLSMKAGATPSVYAQHPTIYRYEVEHIEENFDAILSL
ncbi:MAG: AmmeMemoRadiSam system protein A [Campylobacterota bacterium]|nr:AmmeMemoRadiSam system protein A [Campylobacterota bacterium]